MRASANSRVLVIGYGSTLRGDDGVGRYVADAIGQQGRPQVEVVSVTQLLPEFAGPVANARAVIFVDACCDDAFVTTQVWKLSIEPISAGQTHYAGPADILRLSQTCYGRVPRAWLVSVPAKHFGLTGELSPTVRRHAETAVKIVGKLIDEALCGDKHSTAPLAEGVGSKELVGFPTPVQGAHYA